MDLRDLKKLLDNAINTYHNQNFIVSDPICIPHLFHKKEDIEIAGLFAAIFAWGQRKTIINKTKDLLNRMDNAPFEFIISHSESDLKKLLLFKHRTFNDTDLLYSIEALHYIYKHKNGLEEIFTKPVLNERNTEKGIINFHHTFFSLPEYPHRTKKHFPSPTSGSTCKRINMYLRWMVRKDDKGVDFGIWKNIESEQLLCPLDVHVDTIARHFGLITRKQTDWKTVIELTENLKKLNKKDPVIYDFALFSLGINDFI
jgi:uncharacterized protein (TIGR02757 family)